MASEKLSKVLSALQEFLLENNSTDDDEDEDDLVLTIETTKELRDEFYAKFLPKVKDSAPKARLDFYIECAKMEKKIRGNTYFFIIAFMQEDEELAKATYEEVYSLLYAKPPIEEIDKEKEKALEVVEMEEEEELEII